MLYKAPCGPVPADDGSLLGSHGWTGTALVACYVPGDGVWNGHLGQLPVHHFRGCEGRGASRVGLLRGRVAITSAVSDQACARPGACGERVRSVSAFGTAGGRALAPVRPEARPP